MPPAPPKPLSESPAAIQNPGVPGIGPEQRVAVGRHRVGVADERHDARVLEEREPPHGPRHELGEALVVGRERAGAVIPGDAVHPAGHRVRARSRRRGPRRPPSAPYTRLSVSRKHGMSRGSSWPSTASRAMCWWSTGTDGVNAPTIAATWGAQIPQAFTTASVSIGPAVVSTARHLAARPEADTRHARAVGSRRRARGRRRRARRSRCGGRPSRRPHPHRPVERLRRSPAACSASACLGPTTSTSRPIPRARLAPRRSSIRLSLLEAIRRLPSRSNTPSSS